MRKVQPYRFVPQTSYSVEQFDRGLRGSGFPPPEPLFFRALGQDIGNNTVTPAPATRSKIVTPAKEAVKKFAATHPLVSPAEAGAHCSAARTFHRWVRHCDCLVSSEQWRDGSRLAPRNMSVG